MKQSLCVWPLFFLSLASVESVVAEPLNYDVIQLQANAMAEVSNDTLIANMFVEDNQADPQRLGVLLNKRLEDAVQIAKSYPAVKVTLQSQQTYPVYGTNNKLQGWRGRLDIKVVSEDFSSASQLIGKLQPALQIGGINFIVSDKKRERAESDLTVEALKVFKQKASLVTNTLANGKTYRIVSLQVGSESMGPQPYMQKLARASVAADGLAEVSPGESKVGVVVSGQVQIQP